MVQNFKQQKYKKFFRKKTFKYNSAQNVLKKRLRKLSYKLTPVQGILNLKFSFNNTLVVLTDLSGNVKFSTSAGRLDFKNSQKSTWHATEMVVKELSLQTLELGYERVFLHLSGISKEKIKCLRLINKAGLNVISIADFTSIPHNGCRPPKIRRL